MRVRRWLPDIVIEFQVANQFLVDIIIHTAGSIDARLAIHLIKALGKRREVTGNDTFHIHVSQ